MINLHMKNIKLLQKISYLEIFQDIVILVF
jgi:hypothetical protein